MTTYALADNAPNRQQWEESSRFSQSWNCGVTVAAFIGGYFKNTRPAIEALRRLIAGMGPYSVNGVRVWGCPPQTATTGAQQRDMLIKQGIPATTRYLDTVEQLHGLVDSGRRPIIVGILMGRVPEHIRGHKFLGWHAVGFITGAWVNGIRGFWILDPNFPAGDPRSQRFYPDWVVVEAWQKNAPRWCVVPDRAKAAPASSFSEAQEMAIMAKVKSAKGRYFDCAKGITLRKGPGTAYPYHWKTDRALKLWLHGFSPNGWAMASREESSTGFFFVPPIH